MLTVRWLEQNGVDTIMEADRVSAQPRIDPDNVDRGRRELFVDRPSLGVLCIDKGTVYVMNDKGRTVATYDQIQGSVPPIDPSA